MINPPRDLAELLTQVDALIRRLRADYQAARGDADLATTNAGRGEDENPWAGVSVRSSARADTRLLPGKEAFGVAARRPEPPIGHAPGPSPVRLRPADVARRPPNPPHTLRMGFVVDVVGYGLRPWHLRGLVQRRVSDLKDAVLEHLDVDPRDVDQQGTGDGVLVFLPVDLDVPRAVSRLLSGWRDFLDEDNRLYRDRLRLRMAVVLGPVAPGPLGFVGSPAIVAGRLLNSGVLRAAAVDNPGADMVVLLSDALHSFAVDPADPAFTRHWVDVKDFRGHGWLWVG